MKLVRNGEMGVLVNQADITKLTTPKAIEDEINRITLGDYEVVRRDHNTVVAPEEYIAYLNGLLASAKEKSNKPADQTDTTPDQSAPADQTDATPDQPTPADDIPVPDENKLDVEAGLRQRDQIIEQLLKVAKAEQKRANEAEAKLNTAIAEIDAADAENKATEPVYYEGSVPESEHRATATIKEPLAELLRIVYGDSKISLFANIAVARGLLGDARAETLIDNIYDEGTYSKFIDALKGDTTVDNSAEQESKPSESDTEWFETATGYAVISRI